MNLPLISLVCEGPVENPYHENSTYGESKPVHYGFEERTPTVGERYDLIPSRFQINGNDIDGISTSPVQKIINDDVFETLNSRYRIIKREEVVL